MRLKRGYAEHADVVVLTASRDDYEALMDALRTLAGIASMNRDRVLLDKTARLADRLNDGNKAWRPVPTV